MKLFSQTSAFLAAITIAVSVISIQSHPNNSEIRPLYLSKPKLTCPTQFNLEKGYQREENGIQFRPNFIKLEGISYIKGHICSAGTLIIDAEGQLGGEELPRLTVGLDSKIFSEQSFSKRRVIHIFLPHKGQLTLGYFNDYYNSEARIAFILNPRFRGDNCDSLNINVPKDTGGVYNEETQTIDMTARVPMNFQPCDTGTLQFDTLGYKGGGQFPVLEVSQNNKLLATLYTTAQQKRVQLLVNSSAVSVTLVNPFFREIANRNLILHSVKFIPTNSP